MNFRCPYCKSVIKSDLDPNDTTRRFHAWCYKCQKLFNMTIEQAIKHEKRLEKK